MWLSARKLNFIWGGKHAFKLEDTKDKLEQMKSKGAVKKGDDLGGHGVCQKGNKTSE